jgi:hypothetical protein
MSERAAALLFRHLLVLSIAFAPMVPAFAASKIGVGEHMAHGHMHDVGKVSGDQAQPHSGKHLNCNGHCCLACGMAFVQTNVAWVGAEHTRSILIPIVVHLHALHVVTVPRRPPRTLS